MVCREMYQDFDRWSRERIGVEDEWPEYKNSLDIISMPSFLHCEGTMGQTAPSEESEQWARAFSSQTQTLQQKKQHHVHIVDKNSNRQPLSHCKRPDNPKLCKADFPRDKRMCEDGIVLCLGMMKRMGVLCSGKKLESDHCTDLAAMHT